MTKRVGLLFAGVSTLAVVTLGRLPHSSPQASRNLLAIPTLPTRDALPSFAPAATASMPSTAALPPEPEDPTILGNWSGRLAKPLVSLAREREVNGPSMPERIELTLSSSEAVTVVVNRFDPLGQAEGVFEGVVEGKTGSTVILSYVGLAQSGIVHLPGERRAFRIRGNDEGEVNITEVDLTNAPDCGPVIPAHPVFPAAPRS